MKKLIPLLIACACWIPSAAQKIDAEKVPTAIAANFQASYPNASNVEWEREGNRFEATFKKGPNEISVVYDGSANWLETETKIKLDALPDAVQNTLAAEYADYSIEEVCRVERAKGGPCYEVELTAGSEKLELRFAPDGQLLGSSEDEDDAGEMDDD